MRGIYREYIHIYIYIYLSLSLGSQLVTLPSLCRPHSSGLLVRFITQRKGKDEGFYSGLTSLGTVGAVKARVSLAKAMREESETDKRTYTRKHGHTNV